jgi:hypothetical protein
MKLARTNDSGARMWARKLRLLQAKGAEGQRGASVHHHRGAGHDADQLAPAWEGQQEQQADDRRDDDPEDRDLDPLGVALKRLRDVAVLAQPEADPRRGREVDQPGAGRRDERIDAQDECQPCQSGHLGHRVERSLVQRLERGAVAGHRQPCPRSALGEQLGIQRPDERNLHQHVDGGADQDREDYGAWQVTARISRFAAQLHRLLEAEQ